MTKVILFDLDGTLLKSGGAGRTALNKALKNLYGKDNICTIGFLAGSTDKDNFARAYEKATGKKSSSKNITDIKKEYLKFLPSEVEKAVTKGNYFNVKGIEKLLKKIYPLKDVLVGLGTGNVKTGAHIKLAPSGLSKYFSFGGFGCDSEHRHLVLKKAVARAEKIIGKKISPSAVYIIGDTEKDVCAAKKAGFHSAAVTCGYGKEKELLHCGPELIAEDFSDTDLWLIWLGIKKDPKGIKRKTFCFPNTPIEHISVCHTGSSKLRDEDI